MRERLLQKIIPLVLIGISLAISVYGIAILLQSPYTGIRVAASGEAGAVAGVDRGSPAFGKIRPGDRLIELDGLRLSPVALKKDPDDIGTRAGQRNLWKWIKILGETIKKGRPVGLTVLRRGKPVQISVVPGAFPVAAMLARAWPVFLAGWLNLVIGSLVFRKKANDVASANLVNGFFVGINLITLGVYASRDLAFPFGDFRLLYALNAASCLIFSASFVHQMLVFPARKKILSRYPRLVYAPYAAALVVMALHFGEVFENRYLTLHVPLALCMAALTARFIYDYYTDSSPLHKKQVQWVAFGGGVQAAIWIGLTALPLMITGKPFVREELTAAFMIFYPLAIAAAITRYRLMDIESVFDYTVVYGLTLLILEGVEMWFWREASPYMLRDGLGRATTLSVAVLIVVFLYAPLRNAIRQGVERLFRRGSYDVNREANKLYLRIGTHDGLSVFEHFSFFVRGLLASSGVLIMELDRRGTASLRHADGNVTESAALLLPEAGRLEQGFQNGRHCIVGYERAEWFGPNFIAEHPELEKALYVFFPMSASTAGARYLAVLLGKWNGFPYSGKDKALMEAVTPNMTGIIMAEELQREKEALERRYAIQREKIVGELHDGLGGILTTITATAQIAGRMFHKDEARAESMVTSIEGYSREALDFLRTGLIVLEDPEAAVGTISAHVERRYGDLFSAYGMSLQIACDDAARAFRPGAYNTIQMLRTIQESISNIIKHANAKRVHIGFTVETDGLLVSVRDDGKGFDTGKNTPGLGLKSMEKRIAGIGGRFELAASPGRGTQVTFRLPMSRA
jgi:signal transduction histidine kinase